MGGLDYYPSKFRHSDNEMPPLTEEQDQKQKARECNKQYREANRGKILEYKKQYYEANKEKILENNKQYREANKEKIQEKKRIDRQRKKTCECGCEVFARHYARHRRTIKHELLMNAS
jgi:Spy/CpxP family protein refolding chaperone